MKYRLKHDVHLAHCWPNQGGMKWPATFPAGTPVICDGSSFAIASSQRVAELTGNTHDAYHRYVWIDAEHVEEIDS